MAKGWDWIDSPEKFSAFRLTPDTTPEFRAGSTYIREIPHSDEAVIIARDSEGNWRNLTGGALYHRAQTDDEIRWLLDYDPTAKVVHA